MPRAHVTDTMIPVASLQDALPFWTDTLGLAQVGGGEGWVLLEDPHSRHKISLVEGDFGAQWAIAVAAADLEAALEQIRAAGGRAADIRGNGVGFRTALCHAPDGCPVLVYEETP